MPDRRAQLKVGIFSMLAIVLLVAGGGLLAGGSFIRTAEDYTLYFEGSVAGLNVGAPVVFRGVPLGKVTSISLVASGEDNAITIPVGIDIFEKQIRSIGLSVGVSGSEREEIIAGMVGRGLRARIATASYLTGHARVELDMHPETPIRFHSAEPEHEIPTLSSPLEEFSKALSRINIENIAHGLLQALESFNSVMGGEELKGTLSGVRRLTDELASLAREMPALAQSAGKTLQHVETAADRTVQEVSTIGHAMSATLGSFNRAAGRAEELFLNTSRLTAPNSATVRDLQNAVKEMAEAAKAVRGLAKSLERNPESLLRGRGRQQP